jgi:XapX domain-containing protein
MQMTDFYSLLVGLVIGCGFTLIRLPIPAPTTLGGILAVVGVGLGGALGAYLLTLFSR